MPSSPTEPKTEERPIRVAVVEDDAHIREGLVGLIEGAEGFACVGAFRTAEEACRDLPAKKPDVVLMDINLPRMSGVDCVRELKSRGLPLKVVMHTVYSDGLQLFESLRAGADGYLLKRTPPAVLLQSLIEVHQGKSPMTGEMARMVVEYFHQRSGGSAEEHLTQREREILENLVEGYRYKEIADRLSISVGTVRTHLKSIYDKLHVTSRTEAVVKYLKNRPN